MSRITASLFLFVFCTFGGILWRRKIHRQEQVLRQMCLLLRQMRTRLAYLHTPFPGLVASFGESREFGALTFLSDCAVQCAAGTSFPEAWCRAVRQFRHTGAWSTAVGEDVASLAQAACGADAESVDRVLALYEEMMQTHLHTAQERTQGYGRQCVQICSAVGLLIGILIL